MTLNNIKTRLQLIFQLLLEYNLLTKLLFWRKAFYIVVEIHGTFVKFTRSHSITDSIYVQTNNLAAGSEDAPQQLSMLVCSRAIQGVKTVLERFRKLCYNRYE